jgi:hypothetical protein
LGEERGNGKCGDYDEMFDVVVCLSVVKWMSEGGLDGPIHRRA